MIFRYFLNLYRFTDKNLILKCHFNGYFRVFLSKMGTLNLFSLISVKKRVGEVEKIIILSEKKNLKISLCETVIEYNK